MNKNKIVSAKTAKPALSGQPFLMLSSTSEKPETIH